MRPKLSVGSVDGGGRKGTLTDCGNQTSLEVVFPMCLLRQIGKTTSGEIIAESQRKSQDFTPDIRTGQSDQSLGQPFTGDAGIASVTPGAGSPKNSQLGGKCVDHSACDPTLGISKTVMQVQLRCTSVIV